MDKNDASINNFNHSISLLEKKTLVITGVKKIDNFDKTHFLLDTTMGYMLVKGEDLELIKLDTFSGNVTIKGIINNLDYITENNKKSEDSIFSRLFRS